SPLAALEALAAWRVSGSPKRQANWTAKHWADLQCFIDVHTSGTPTAQPSPSFREVGDGAATLARLSEVETLIRPRAFSLLDKIEALTRRLRELDAALARADNASAGILLDELRLADQRVGATEAMLRARHEELKVLRGQTVTLERLRKQLLEEQAGV